MAEPRRRRAGLWWTATLGLLALGGLAVLAWGGDAWQSIRAAGWRGMAALVALTTLGYQLRFVKWHVFLRRRADLGLGTSGAVFTAGLLLALTPGKVGELWKAWAVARRTAQPTARFVPVVVMERLTDLVSVAALAALGLRLLDHSLALPAAALVAALGVAALLWWRRPWMALRRRMAGRWPRVIAGIDDALVSARDLMRPAPVAAAMVLSLAAWALEGATMWYALHIVGSPLPMTTAQFVFAAGTLVGALSFLPGGVVATEIGMVGLLVASGVEAGAAAAATAMVRVSTLWYGAALGGVAFVAASPDRPGRVGRDQPSGR